MELISLKMLFLTNLNFYKWLILTISIFVFIQLEANNDIPSARKVDWSKAGLYFKPEERIENWINVENYSGNDYDKIMSAIDDARKNSSPTVIYLPAENYTFTQAILLNPGNKSPIRLTGNLSPDTTTTLTFTDISADEDCFFIKGRQESSAKMISGDIIKGSNKIELSNEDSATFHEGDWIQFTEPGFDDKYGDSSSYIGQVSKIVNIGSDYIEIKDQASKKYSITNQLKIIKINPAQQIGFENFKIERTNQLKGNGATFKFDLAVNGWIKGVESYNCTGYHVQISRSSHILISGNYFQEATNYDSYPGSGYGVVSGKSTTNCLIENNIFNRTRHAMLVGTGANSNVFGYNYSINDTWDVSFFGEYLEAGDIRLHGRYPYSNLFEGNSVDFIWGDATHGLNGPYNTFFRNEVRENLHSFYSSSIIMWNADSSNIVANVVKSDIDTASSGLESIIQSLRENYDQHDSRGVLISSNSSINSYYLNSKPDYFINSAYSWPAIGNASENNMIPAKKRWSDSIKTYYKFGQLKINDPIKDIEVSEDASPTKIDMKNIFSNPENPVSDIELSVIHNSKPSLLSTFFNQDTLQLEYRANQNGEAEITVKGVSEWRSATATFHVKVRPINDAPIFTKKLPDTTINNNANEFSFLYQARDIEDDSLRFGISKPISGLSISQNGGITWSLPEDPDNKYEIDIYVTDGIDTTRSSASVHIKNVTTINTESNTPDQYFLSPGYPNPFNPVIHFQYGIPEKSHVKIFVFNINGELIRTLGNDFKNPGIYKVSWSPKGLPTGIYFLRIMAKDFSSVEKCVLMK